MITITKEQVEKMDRLLRGKTVARVEWSQGSINIVTTDAARFYLATSIECPGCKAGSVELIRHSSLCERYKKAIADGASSL